VAQVLSKILLEKKIIKEEGGDVFMEETNLSTTFIIILER
jgi:hypothetical protein